MVSSHVSTPPMGRCRPLNTWHLRDWSWRRAIHETWIGRERYFITLCHGHGLCAFAFAIQIKLASLLAELTVLSDLISKSQTDIHPKHGIWPHSEFSHRLSLMFFLFFFWFVCLEKAPVKWLEKARARWNIQTWLTDWDNRFIYLMFIYLLFFFNEYYIYINK